MNLKEDLVSKHMLFQGQNPSNENIETLRNEALEQFDKQGFPTKQDEEWKYTSLKSILKHDYKLFPESEDALDYGAIKKFLIHDIESYLIVFVNGVYSSFLSKTTHDEADVCILSSALSEGVHQPVLENFYHKIADAKQNMVALNTAFTREGAYVYIPANTIVSRPIQVVYFSTNNDNQVFYQPRNLVVVGDNSEVQIIERHQTLDGQANFTNAVTEIAVGKNANLDYYKIQNDTAEASLVDSTFVRQERDSVAAVHTFSMGGHITRNNLSFYQEGENCNSILNGITLGTDNQLIDHHTLVNHAQPHCESHELYKGILNGKSKGVFNGKVIVHPDAQKINAFQQNNNILLSDTASIDTKPQLEIFADDVKCSHGCTVGQLNEDALFYMQSRGIPFAEARALLMYAFTADALEQVRIPQIKSRIHKLIAQKLNVSLEFDW